MDVHNHGPTFSHLSRSFSLVCFHLDVEKCQKSDQIVIGLSLSSDGTSTDADADADADASDKRGILSIRADYNSSKIKCRCHVHGHPHLPTLNSSIEKSLICKFIEVLASH